MNEYATVYEVSAAGLLAVIGSFLYSLGGRNHKWLRRYLSSLLIGVGVNVLCLLRGSWSPWLIAITPILVAGLSLGYGADGLWQKVGRRAICAITVSLSGGACYLALGPKALFILIPQVGLSCFTVYLGTKNPIEAAAEEFMIGMMYFLPLMMYPFIA